jgi:hypothetical protein
VVRENWKKLKGGVETIAKIKSRVYPFHILFMRSRDWLAREGRCFRLEQRWVQLVWCLSAPFIGARQKVSLLRRQPSVPSRTPRD